MGVIESLSGADPLAIWREENPLTQDLFASPEPTAPPLASWSGWIPADADPSLPGIHTWTGQGWNALTSMCDRLGPIHAERGQQILFRPCASHVLSDPRSCLTFFRDRTESPFGLLLDPIAMLTPPMLPDASDHLDRTLSTLLTRPETRGVVLADATISESAIAHAPLGQGSLQADLVASIIERVGESGLPIILLGDPEPQIPMLDAPRAAKVRPAPRTP